MKTTNKHPFLIMIMGLLAVLTSGCVDDVDIHNQVRESQKLVLYARLCPQMDTTYILLTTTKLLYTSHNETYDDLSNGIVELSADGTHWVQAHYYPANQHFLITREEFPVEEGGTYYIRASYPGFDEVSSSCTVPLLHDVGFRFDTVSVNSDMHGGTTYNWPHKDVYAEWQDVPGEENAYGVKIHYQVPYYVIGPDGDDYYDYYWQYDSETLTDGNEDVKYVTDEGRDGTLMRFLMNINIDENSEDYLPTEYYLFFLDKSCYLFENSISNDYDMDLEFLMLEPTHTYTNIENGFGLFGAFCMQKVE